MAGDLSLLALSERVCVCARLQVSVLETAWACVSACLTSPEEMPFLAAGRSALACWCAKFRLLLSNFSIHPIPPPISSQAGRQGLSSVPATTPTNHQNFKPPQVCVWCQD